MVRRPLLLVLTSFILGSLLYEVPLSICFLIVGGITSAVVIVLIRISKNRHDVSLLLVPVFFLVGNLLMANQQQSGPIDSYLMNADSITTTVVGRVHSIQSTKKSYKIILEQVHYEMTQVPSKYIIIYYNDVSSLSIGNKIKVGGELSKFRLPTNEYQFDEASYNKIEEMDYQMFAKKVTKVDEKVNLLANGLYRVRLCCGQVFSGIQDQPAKESLSAMLLGEKSEMEEEVKGLYQAGGIAHVISISGLHVALLGMAVFEFIKRMIGLKAGVVSAIVFIFCYGILTNFSVSTNRAVIMLMLLLVAKLAGRTYDLLSAVSLSGLMILLRQPMQVFQCGFLLSYGAILGIAVVCPCLESIIDDERLRYGVNWKEKEFLGWKKTLHGFALKFRYYVVKAFMMQLSIFVVTLPILLWFYYRFATYAFALNLLVLPLMTYVVLFGVIGAAVGCFLPAVGQVILLPAIYIIRFYLFLCEAVTRLPFHYVVTGRPEAWKMVLYGILLIGAAILLKKKYRSGLLLVILGILLFFVRMPEKNLCITSVDVGQGDCYIIRSPLDGIYVIDGGSTSEKEVGKYRILPYLYGSGIDHITTVFVTHGDEDHTSGILELLEAAKNRELAIDTLIVSYSCFEDKNLDALVEKARECGVAVKYMEAGGYVKNGDISFTCLHPRYGYQPSGANDESLCLSLSYRGFSMLFMGDLTTEAEVELKRNGGFRQYDALKVAHHGSKYSTSLELLESMSPKVALISCGKKNRYGHPHKELLDRLKSIEVRAYMTKESGMIWLSTDGSKIWMRQFVRENGKKL